MIAPLEYAAPASLDRALKLLEGGALPLAGGTDLLSLLKDRLVEAKRVVDLKGIPELSRLAAGKDGLRIGATVRLGALAADATVRRDYPALAQAVEGIRSAQLHAMGTVGGDLLQRPRCWYFRNGFGLLGVRDGSSLVAAGDNRYHAILGNAGAAKYVHPSSLAPALVAFGATATITGPNGERTVRVDELWRTPARDGEDERTLAPGEILTAIVVPPAAGRKSATYEVRQHASLDWPLAAAAVVLDAAADAVASARIVLGHVAPVPWPAPAAGSAVAGKRIDGSTAAAAGAAAVAGATPLSGNGYKARLASVAVKRALLRAVGKEA